MKMVRSSLAAMTAVALVLLLNCCLALTTKSCRDPPTEPYIYSIRPHSLRAYHYIAINRTASKVFCDNNVVAGTPITCHVRLRLPCGGVLGDAGDLTGIRLSLCPSTSTTSTSGSTDPILYSSPTWFMDGEFDFTIQPLVAGWNTINVGVGNGTVTLHPTRIFVRPGPVYPLSSDSACAMTVDGLSEKCTITHRDRYGNAVKQCSLNRASDGSSWPTGGVCHAL
jgi:hypothetical protein